MERILPMMGIVEMVWSYFDNIDKFNLINKDFNFKYYTCLPTTCSDAYQFVYD